MKGGRSRAAAAATLALVAALAICRPHVVQTWGLYAAGRASTAPPVLFVDPFLEATQCAQAARAVVASGDRATCRARARVVFAASPQFAALERDFAPGGTWDRLVVRCGLRAPARASASAART